MKSKNDNLNISIALLVVMAVILMTSTVVTMKINRNHNEKSMSTSSDISIELKSSVKTDEELTAAKYYTQQEGKDKGTFYSGDNNTVVKISNGKNTVDVSKMIKGWSFGVPLIGLRDFASLYNLNITDLPMREMDLATSSTVDVYSGSNEVSNELHMLYLYDKDWHTVKYCNLSRKALFENHEIQSATVPQYDPNTDDLIVAIDQLPVVDNSVISFAGKCNVQYTGNAVVYNFA